MKDQELSWKDILTDKEETLAVETAAERTRAAHTLLKNKGLLDSEYLDLLLEFELQDEIKHRFTVAEERVMLDWLNLPYAPEPGVPAVRIVDVASIVIGLVYACAPEAAREKLKQDRSWAWQLALHYLFFYVPKLQPALPELPLAPEELQALVCIAAGRELTDSQRTVLEGKEIGIVKGGAVKIKQYFLESNKIHNIRGASHLLEEINQQDIPAILAELALRQSIIYCGAGNVLAAVPAELAATVARRIEGIYRQKTRVAQAVAVGVRVPLLQLAAENYERIIGWIEEEKGKRQRGILPVYSDVYRDRPQFVSEEDYFCQHCGNRVADSVLRIGQEQEKVCPACEIKTNAGKEVKKGLFRKFDTYVGRFHQVQLKSRVNQSLNDLGPYIAVIYGDGNNFGSRVKQQKCLGHARCFSNRVARAAFDSVFEGIYKIWGLYSRVEFIALGGDDIFLITPATGAIEAAIEMGREFDQQFLGEKGKPTLTMSTGVAIARHDTPIAFLFQIAQELLKLAKGRVKELQGEQVASSGTIDFAVLESYGSFSISVKDYREKTFSQDEDLSLTLRPYTWETADEILALTRLLKKLADEKKLGKSNLYGLRKYVELRPLPEANLYYLYQLSRLLKNEPRQAVLEQMRRLQESITGKGELPERIWVDDYTGGKAVPWLDVLEIWDYVKEGEFGDEVQEQD
ncbi:hypothetical protein [Carboxydocella sp. JDF658]|uniref:Cas10/Cmr2 second palm domain-containing protein n=1 Tax=Carboxydocella sp. JDF658 TaxID=1926600 RepID=UPI0009AE7356|nr:hypothetical protein [Carboxydocella sp. JDF658]GAW32176.1 hypothetical protein JDF658_19410 [Carboxydocella sp. JDF658]